VYLYLKSSDYVGHDLDPEMVFDGCIDQNEGKPKGGGEAGEGDEGGGLGYELELVLKKWYNVERSREMRCFVRDNVLIGKYPFSFPSIFFFSLPFLVIITRKMLTQKNKNVRDITKRRKLL
jgi:hypothetical protein